MGSDKGPEAIIEGSSISKTRFPNIQYTFFGDHQGPGDCGAQFGQTEWPPENGAASQQGWQTAQKRRPGHAGPRGEVHWAFCPPRRRSISSMADVGAGENAILIY